MDGPPIKDLLKALYEATKNHKKDGNCFCGACKPENDGAAGPHSAPKAPFVLYDLCRNESVPIQVIEMYINSNPDELNRRRVKSGRTPFYRAVQHRNYSLVKLLMARGADVTIPHIGTRATPLHLAVAGGDMIMADMILTQNPNNVRTLLDAVNSEGNTPLHLAGKTYSRVWSAIPLIGLLIKHGASITARNNAGLTPFLYVVARGDGLCAVYAFAAALPFCQLPLADVTNEGLTVLHIAALGGYPEMVQALLAFGASTTAKNNHGKTPAEMATSLTRDVFSAWNASTRYDGYTDDDMKK